MHPHAKTWLLALGIATLAFGCVTSAPSVGDADAQRDALARRARSYKAEAERVPDSLPPGRKAELEQLADDVRAWQARTGKNDIRVTEDRVTQARRANDSGTDDCNIDCPRYELDGDKICFLVKSECSSAPETYGTLCIYSCISMASTVAPERSGE